MPCWYYEKKELKNTPSYLDSIDSLTESRYRREGARFIFDAGTKMGLRYDSCATGVVYFHRFYMFHSFKEFHRYVTGACCLFLAGKVEETPKKCKDIIKTCRSLLTEQQFSVFGEDPREEVMTLERILLQTIKFDLQVEHPYTRLLHYAKLLKGDKQKIQKVVQMAWTFINDSMCTMLCLQWEPDIISVSMLYLATRLSKLDIQDWVGKPPGSKLKWWEGLVEDLSQELIEDICHQVLDLYSSKSQKRELSPPMSASLKPEAKKSRNSSPLDDRLPGKNSGGKSSKLDKSHEESSRRYSKGHSDVAHGTQPPLTSAPVSHTVPPSTAASGVNTRSGGHHPSNPAYPGADNSNYNQFNPYGSSQALSSFMSQEGSQSIQSLITGGDGGSQPYNEPPTSDYQSYQQAGYQPPGYGNNPPPPSQPYPPPAQPYAGYHHPPAAYPPAPGVPNQPPPSYPGGAYQNPPPQQYNYNQDFNQQGYPQSFPPTGQPSFQNNTYGPPRGPPPKNAKNKKTEPHSSSCLAQVRITGR